MLKASSASAASKLTDIPNVGPSIAADLNLIGIKHPAELRGRDACELYERLNQISGRRHDPCVLDTFMAAVDFMNGGAARPWWNFTPERKRRLTR